MKIQPLYDKLLVTRSKDSEQTPGGLFKPLGAQEKQNRGEVVAVGQGRLVDGEIRPLTIVPGNVVMFGKFAGDEIEVDGDKFLIISEHDVLAVIEP